MIHVEYEHPYRAIIDAAKKNGCDLVAMASHGRQGLSAVVLGSVTVKVLTHSNIPRFGVSITSCWWVIAPFQLLTKLLSKLDQLGCFSFLARQRELLANFLRRSYALDLKACGATRTSS